METERLMLAICEAQAAIEGSSRNEFMVQVWLESESEDAPIWQAWLVAHASNRIVTPINARDEGCAGASVNDALRVLAAVLHARLSKELDERREALKSLDGLLARLR